MLHLSTQTTFSYQNLGGISLDLSNTDWISCHIIKTNLRQKNHLQQVRRWDDLPCIPVEAHRLVFTVKNLAEASIWHVVINQQVSLMVWAATQKTHYIAVTDFSQSLNLRRESVVVWGSLAFSCQPLHSHDLSAWHHPFVYSSCPTSSNDVVFIQAIQHLKYNRFSIKSCQEYYTQVRVLNFLSKSSSKDVVCAFCTSVAEKSNRWKAVSFQGLMIDSRWKYL